VTVSMNCIVLAFMDRSHQGSPHLSSLMLYMPLGVVGGRKVKGDVWLARMVDFEYLLERDPLMLEDTCRIGNQN
jgi:hypothetical protein